MLKFGGVSYLLTLETTVMKGYLKVIVGFLSLCTACSGSTYVPKAMADFIVNNEM
jgi:hypothetical protein